MKTYEPKIIKLLDEVVSYGLPVIAFCDNLRAFLNYGIRARNDGDYSHGMLIINANGEGASQDFVGFRIIDFPKRYMQPGFRLKFFAIADITPEEAQALIDSCYEDAKKPWWKRNYDVLGFFGQLIGVPAINNPWRKFCIEDVVYRIKKYVKSKDYSDIGNHLNPTQLNKICSNDSRFIYLGHWFAD